MSELAKEAGSIAEPTPLVPEVAAEPVQRLVGYMKPAVQRVAGAVTGAQAAIEKRLGFCPGKEIAKAASAGLDALADGLHRIASRLRTFAGGAPQADEGTDAPSSPPAQA
jgi:hypothetical protein